MRSAGGWWQSRWVLREFDEAIEDGAWGLAIRIALANPDLFGEDDLGWWTRDDR